MMILNKVSRVQLFFGAEFFFAHG